MAKTYLSSVNEVTNKVSQHNIKNDAHWERFKLEGMAGLRYEVVSIF